VLLASACSRKSNATVDPKAVPPPPQPRLEEAIDRQDYEGARAALADGARVDDTLSTGLYPLGAAVMRENVSLVRLMLQAAADPNAPVRAGSTYPPLAAAVHAHGRELVDELLAAGADPNRRFGPGLAFTPLGEAATSSTGLGAIIALTQAGADPNARVLDPPSKYPRGYRPGRNEGRTPLMLAAAAGFYGNVIALLNGGADPTLRDEDGLTALALMGDPTSRLREVLVHPETYMRVAAVKAK
jgi:ankyrin repeat protein